VVGKMDYPFLQKNLWILGLVVLWEIAWKGLALWKAARNGEKYWFLALLFINTVGLLPIYYLLRKNYRNNNFKLHLHA
jgi:hypothetical protein